MMPPTLQARFRVAELPGSTPVAGCRALRPAGHISHDHLTTEDTEPSSKEDTQLFIHILEVSLAHCEGSSLLTLIVPSSVFSVVN
jgi:hypothetical protein